MLPGYLRYIIWFEIYSSWQRHWVLLTLYFNWYINQYNFLIFVNCELLINKDHNVLRRTTLSSLEDGSETNLNFPANTDKRVDFLLCPSCFWCASYLNFGELSIIRCPICHNNRVEQLPVLAQWDRSYTYRSITQMNELTGWQFRDNDSENMSCCRLVSRWAILSWYWNIAWLAAK